MNFDYFDRIDRYARGSMTEPERHEFEQLLRSDPRLSQEWEDYSLIAKSVRNSIRAKTLGTQGHIFKLVEDARELAKENGLLITIEDVWDYLRGTVPPSKKILIERRKTKDPAFLAVIESERAIIRGIQNFGAGIKLIQKARKSLHLEGFPDSIHEQILSDIQQEKKTNQATKPENSQGNESKIFAALAILVLLVALIILWFLFYT